jgi:deazaflavin-dependent oxidoreductase (nitroreductase family)
MTDQAQRRAWNQQVIEEFRANAGVVGGDFAGTPLLLLTTRGARTGEPRISPLRSCQDGDRYYVFAANGGRPTHPGWYYNLLAHPEVTVEVGTECYPARAVIAEGAERERLWQAAAAEVPALNDFQAKVPHPIPIVVLERR